MGKINQKQNGNGVTLGSGRSYLCLEERIEWGEGKKGGKKRREKKAFNISEVWPLVSPCRGLVDVDSVDQLCEELLHLQGARIQCATSDMERKHDLDVMADGEEHGQTLLCFLPYEHAVKKKSLFFLLYLNIWESDKG